jgi:hypothetical protein
VNWNGNHPNDFSRYDLANQMNYGLDAHHHDADDRRAAENQNVKNLDVKKMGVK